MKSENHKISGKNSAETFSANRANIVEVTSRKVSCDGSNKASSHPLVYLKIDDSNSVICPYCSKIFQYAEVASNNHNSNKH